MKLRKVKLASELLDPEVSVILLSRCICSPHSTTNQKNPSYTNYDYSDIVTKTTHRSQRQARMEEEHQDMLEKLNKIRHTDFDNTKRIERPDEILERRRREREARNVWYRRWGRWITGQS